MLEKAIEENTKAVVNLTKALNSFLETAKPEGDDAKKAPSKAEKAEKQEATKEAKPAKTKKTSAKKSTEKKKESKVDYEKDIRPAIVEFVKTHGKELAVEILHEFDDTIKAAKELDEEHWQDYVDRLKEKAAELEDEDNEDDDIDVA